MWGVTLKTTETLRLRLSDGLRRHHTFHNSLCLKGKKTRKKTAAPNILITITV